MRALSLVGWGLLVVLLDFRVEGVDVVLDPVGWAMVATGLGRVVDRHPAGFDLARVAARVLVVVSALEVVLSVVAPTTVPWTTAVTTVLDVGLVFGLCTALNALLEEPRPSSAFAARVIQVGTVVLGVLSLGVLGWVASAGQDPTRVPFDEMGLPLLLVVAVGLALRVWLVVVVFGAARVVEDGPAATPAKEPDPATP